MTRMSEAQATFTKNILKFHEKDFIDMNDMRESLDEHGITLTQEELESLFNYLKFENSTDTERISQLERYANAHLFRLDPTGKYSAIQDLLRKIALGCGAGVSENDLEIYDQFSERVLSIAELAKDRNCLLYIDAE